MLADITTLADDAVMPGQFFTTAGVSQELTALFQAMLDRAIRDVKQARIIGHRNINPDAITAWEWSQDNDLDWPLSFLNVCYVCKISPFRLRAHLAPYWERIIVKLDIARASEAAQLYQRRRTRIIEALSEHGPCHFHTLRNHACLSPDVLRMLLHDMLADTTVSRQNTERDQRGRRWYQYFLTNPAKALKTSQAAARQGSKKSPQPSAVIKSAA